MRTDRERLNDILMFIEKTLTIYDPNKYDHDETFRYGLVKYLEIIGEASRAMSQVTRDLNKDIEWKEIIGFRNIIVHVYHEIEWDEIKDIIEKDLHLLKEQILILINQYDS